MPPAVPLVPIRRLPLATRQGQRLPRALDHPSPLDYSLIIAIRRSVCFICRVLSIVLQERDNKRTCCLMVFLHTLHRVAAFQHIITHGLAVQMLYNRRLAPTGVKHTYTPILACINDMIEHGDCAKSVSQSAAAPTMCTINFEHTSK
jgi:hypothetical protein